MAQDAVKVVGAPTKVERIPARHMEIPSGAPSPKRFVCGAGATFPDVLAGVYGGRRTMQEISLSWPPYGLEFDEDLRAHGALLPLLAG